MAAGFILQFQWKKYSLKVGKFLIFFKKMWENTLAAERSTAVSEHPEGEVVGSLERHKERESL